MGQQMEYVGAIGLKSLFSLWSVRMGWEGLQVPAYSYPLSAPPTSPSWAGRRKTGTAFEVKFRDVYQCDMLETTVVGIRTPPTPIPQASVPPWFWGEGHTRWRERDWETLNSDEGTYTAWYFLYIRTLCLELFK